MRGLLDVNVLVALIDEEHTFNDRAHRWMETSHATGIATCPLAENGLVRIVSNLNYSKKLRFSPGDVVEKLRHFAKNNDHEFWPDDVSLRNTSSIDAARIVGPRQITDLYLLALAVRHGGRLVTFDEAISLAAVPGARQANLCVI